MFNVHYIGQSRQQSPFGTAISSGLFISKSRKGGRQMNYEQFLEQMKEDLQARFAKDLPPELADVRIGIRDV